MSIDTFLLSSDTTDLDYPEIRPTLDLNFARVKALDPRITFTRSSGGSYYGADGLIKLAGVNEARFDHDPYTGESLGLLVEESRTNLLLRSEEFDSGSWVKVASSVSSNTATSPAGTLTADSLVENTASGTQHYTSQTVTISANTIHTATVYVKANTRSSVRFGFLNNVLSNGAFAHFNVSTGAISTQTTAGTASNVSFNIETAVSGWYRCQVTCTVDISSTLGTVFIGLVDGTNNVVYTGDGTSGIFIWGAQLEVGAFPTSYIPTVASTRTRAADNARITGKNFSDFYNPSEFTMRCIFSRFSNNSPPYPLAISSSVISNTALPSIRIRTDGNRSVEGQAVSKENIVVYNNNVSTFLNINQPCNAAIAVKSGDTIYSDSGKLAPVSNLTGSFDGATTLHMGGLTGEINGHIRNVTYYPKRLPNSQLQALTR